MASLFGGGSRNTASSPFGPGAPSQIQTNEKIEAAAMEVDLVSDLFNKLVKSCHAKCIPDGKYHEGSLNKGEGVCIDRCVAKYFQANEVVGKRMQAQQQQQQQQQQAASGGGIGGLFGM